MDNRLHAHEVKPCLAFPVPPPCHQSFEDPGGEYVLVVACDGSLVRKIQRRRLVVKYKGRYKSLPMPGGQWSVSTLVFK